MFRQVKKTTPKVKTTTNDKCSSITSDNRILNNGEMKTTDGHLKVNPELQVLSDPVLPNFSEPDLVPNISKNNQLFSCGSNSIYSLLCVFVHPMSVLLFLKDDWPFL